MSKTSYQYPCTCKLYRNLDYKIERYCLTETYCKTSIHVMIIDNTRLTDIYWYSLETCTVFKVLPFKSILSQSVHAQMGVSTFHIQRTSKHYKPEFNSHAPHIGQIQTPERSLSFEPKNSKLMKSISSRIWRNFMIGRTKFI